ncbi:MAG: host attachment protein [Sulfuricella denitrificans]|nr:host attachment protein [Sulfuricella denitrificans]
MSTTWILVANASIARLYANHGPKKGLQLIKELAHPESREKAANLVSDRPGHNPGAGDGHGSFVPSASPKHNEAERFAQQLAHEMDNGRTSNSYTRAILVAAPAFMGLLKGCINSHVSKLVSEDVDKDYTKATEKELAGHLESIIFL